MAAKQKSKKRTAAPYVKPQYRIERRIDEGMFKEALQTVNEALEEQPDDVKLWNLKGRILFDVNRYDEALLVCDKIMEMDPTFTIIIVSKSHVLFEMGRFEESLHTINKAIAQGQDRVEVQTTKARLLVIMGRFDEAQTLARQELKKDPKNIRAQELNAEIITMSDVHYKLANRLEEITNADTINSDTETIEKIVELAIDYMDAKNFSKALVVVDKALDIISYVPLILTLKAEILYWLGRSDEALEHIEISRSIDPAYDETWYQKAIILARTNYDESLDALHIATSINPLNMQRAQKEELFRHFLTNERFAKRPGLKKIALKKWRKAAPPKRKTR